MASPNAVTRLADRVAAAASGRRLALAALLYGVCLYFLGGAATKIAALTGGLTVPDLMKGFTARELYERLDAFGDEGRRIYFRAEMVDMVYPLAYGFTCAFAIALAARRFFGGYARARLLVLLPLAAVVCDYLENASILTVLRGWPERQMTIAAVGGVFNTAKWAFAGVAIPLAVVALLALGIAAIRARLTRR
jgi:hypothetical protein